MITVFELRASSFLQSFTCLWCLRPGGRGLTCHLHLDWLQEQKAVWKDKCLLGSIFCNVRFPCVCLIINQVWKVTRSNPAVHLSVWFQKTKSLNSTSCCFVLEAPHMANKVFNTQQQTKGLRRPDVAGEGQDGLGQNPAGLGARVMRA